MPAPNGEAELAIVDRLELDDYRCRHSTRADVLRRLLERRLEDLGVPNETSRYTECFVGRAPRVS